MKTVNQNHIVKQIKTQPMGPLYGIQCDEVTDSILGCHFIKNHWRLIIDPRRGGGYPLPLNPTPFVLQQTFYWK